MSHARHIRQCQAKKLTRNVNKTTCTYNVDTYSHNLEEEYSDEGMFNATLDLGVFPCLILTESDGCRDQTHPTKITVGGYLVLIDRTWKDV